MKRRPAWLSLLIVLSGGLAGPPLAHADLASGPPSQECLKSRPALQSASIIVHGEDLTSDARQMHAWCGRAKEVANAQYGAGLKFSQAVTLLKGLLRHDTNEQARVIERAYVEVLGRGATPSDTSQWQARMRDEGKWWYATLHAELIRQMNKENRAEREGVIRRAYLRSIGRDAKPEERGYWLTRTEHYRLIREANRAWLYSAAGAGELPDVIKRLFKSQNDRWPTEAELTEWMGKFGGQKLTFEEMRTRL